MKTPLLVIVIILVVATVKPLYADDDSRYGRYREGGEWKKEFTDGRCKIKQEAKRDEFKEEVKCD